MEFQVNINNVILAQINQVESGEYNVTECRFNFSSEYEGLTKIAVFTGANGDTYKITILNNKCEIPSELLTESQIVQIGVYAYEVQGTEFVLRYSPMPTRFMIEKGSYVVNAVNMSRPTPTEVEQLQSQITHNANNIEGIQGDIAGINQELVGINGELLGINRDIDDIKAEQTEQNTKIQKNTDDIVEINQNINEIDSHINAINEDIDNLEQDLTNYSLITETGSQINLNVNNTNYQITATLKDKNGNVIYTSNAIDLPIESMIVNASYDKTTKEIVLTLQNGNTLRISIADLVSGLVSETQLQTILANYYTKAQVDNLLSAKANQSSLNQTNQNVTDLTERVSTNETDISAIKTEQTTQNTNIEELQTQVETLQEDLDNANSEIAELNTDITNMRKAMITVEGQGTDITLENTSENKLVEFGLEGRTEQEQLTGKNLFNIDGEVNVQGSNGTIVSGVNEVTGNILKAGRNGSTSFAVGQLFNNLNGKQITISAKVVSTGTGTAGLITVYDNNVQKDYITITTSDKLTYTCTSDNIIVGFSTLNGINARFTDIQVEEGSTATSFEPYCGGIPAPNSGYEIPIKNVTGNANVKIQNKNLWNNELEIAEYDTTGTKVSTQVWLVNTTKIKVKPNTQYTISQKEHPSQYRIVYWEDDTYIMKDQNTQNTTNGYSSYTFTTPINCNYISIHFRTTIERIAKGSYVVQTTDITDAQLEQGSTATSYVPHAEQNLPFTFAEGQRGMQGTKLLDDGRHNARRQVILNGTENWLLWSNPSSSDYIIFYMYSTIFSKAKSNGALLCNYFKKGTYGDFSKEGIAIQYSGDYNCSIVIRKSQLSSLDASGIKQWLSTHNLLVEFELSEEAQKTEIIPYNATQQAQYDARKQATSYDDITYISSESDELGFNMNVVAVANANKVMESELQEIKSAVIALGGDINV